MTGDTAHRIEVLQSWTHAVPHGWRGRCMASVQSWSDACGYRYLFEDDALFERLPSDLAQKTRDQPVVASDLARLAWIEERLQAGADAVLWLDSDVLIIAPELFRVPEHAYALGREVWVQPDKSGRGWKTWRRVHNAALLFRLGNPLLAFYRHAADQIVRSHRPGHLVPQLVGPKLLAALNNLMGGRMPVLESAGMLSPWVIRDLLAGGGAALDAQKSAQPRLHAVNLCASSVACGALAPVDMDDAINVLLTDAYAKQAGPGRSQTE